MESVVPLEKYCKMNTENFNYIRVFFKTLGSIENKRVQLEKEFHKIFALWNKSMNPLPPQQQQQQEQQQQKPATPGVSLYASLTKDEFKKMILMGASKTRYQLVFFILNTLHFIQIDGDYYCYCQDNQKCKVCTIPIILRKM